MQGVRQGRRRGELTCVRVHLLSTKHLQSYLATLSCAEHTFCGFVAEGCREAAQQGSQGQDSSRAGRPIISRERAGHGDMSRAVGARDGTVPHRLVWVTVSVWLIVRCTATSVCVVPRA